MAQILLLGLGGTGSRVVNNVVKLLHLNKSEINNQELCCAVLDTNENDYTAINASGTGVPVIPTSKPQKIRDYAEIYSYLGMDEWCATSPAFLEQSMIDGASELRMKSRIAFMDCLESGVIRDLELMINDVLKNGASSKIRVMIVSSISGGTGSGMFIQVALWLRKFLSQSQITIRGIFMLPDVFVTTLKDVRENKETQRRNYANAYAAIRELNAITKIRLNGTLELPGRIKLGSLFDSEVDKDAGTPVYDYAFFVDNRDENGVTLDSMTDYEKMVAQLVYMQMFAPMKDEMYSEEDNTFLAFCANEEPLYGSCGTAKAEYPVDSVKDYCVICATRDSLTEGWKRIDDEIKAVQDEIEQAERDGIFRNEVLDVRDEFVRRYEEKISIPAEETGADRFFLSISKESKNEKRSKRENGKIEVQYTDKIADFVKLLKTDKIATTVIRYSGMKDYELDNSFVLADHTKEQLEKQVSGDEEGMEDALNTFDAKSDERASAIVDSVFPLSMGDVKDTNLCSIFGLLTKDTIQGTREYIHPLSARYLLYKLEKTLNKELDTIVLAESRADALSGGDIGALFDNPKTAEIEENPEKYLNSKKMLQHEGKFLDAFEKAYVQFITTKIGLCEKYEKERLQVDVYKKLLERINGLIQQFKAFFDSLKDVSKELNKALDKNVTQTTGVVGKTAYIYGSKDAKDEVYRSLNMEIDRSESKINQGVISAVYGRYCVEKRPAIQHNKKYENISVCAAFLRDAYALFKERILGDENNKEKLELDLYTAICRESDAAVAAAGKKAYNKEKVDVLSGFDVETGELRADNSATKRHNREFNDCRQKLYRMAAPFLVHDREKSNNPLGTVTTRVKTFWGFSPAVVAAYPEISTVLGINADLQQDSHYAKNMLFCYRAVYGMEAAYIPKFNELKDGAYYRNYKSVIDEMETGAAGAQGDRAYVRTPHLDKRWHKLLPYIMDEKRETNDMTFFHGFWLALAYGTLKLDKNGNYCLKRTVDTGFGTQNEEFVTLRVADRVLGKTEGSKLIKLLQSDQIFIGTDIPKLEEKYQRELEELQTYIGTQVLQGLMKKDDALNPIDIVTRYRTGRHHDIKITAMLIGGLEKIAAELAAHYPTQREKEQETAAMYGICKRIYDSSERAKDKSEVFSHWEEVFGMQAYTEE